ncbi:MAG: MFS family permease [Candidatus Poriferisodalaceae bacterium]|jgi:MFS family permease
MSKRLLPYYLLVALVMMSMGGIFTLLGELKKELGFAEWQLGLMVGIGFFAAFISQISLARFSDRGYSAQMIRLGLVFLASALAIMSIADDYKWFILARVVLGIGAGCLLPAARRVVVLSDPSKVGENLGTLGSFDVGGFLVGPLIAGVLASFVNFRVPFIVFATLTALLIPAAVRLPADTGKVAERQPVIRPLLALPGIRAMLTVAIGWYAMIGLFEAIWAVMLTDRGAEPWMIAVTMSMVMLPMLFLAPIGGRLAQRRGPHKVATFGVLLIIPAVISYGWVEHLGIITAIAMCQGIGDAIIFPSTQVGTAMAADDELAASAQGLGGATLELTAGMAAILAGFAYAPLGPRFIWTAAGVVLASGAALSYYVSRSLREEGHELVTGRPVSPEPQDLLPSISESLPSD